MMSLEASEVTNTNTYAYVTDGADHLVRYVETPVDADAFLHRDKGTIAFLDLISHTFGVNTSDHMIGTATTDRTEPLRFFRVQSSRCEPTLVSFLRGSVAGEV
jgi:hypothetical protein